MFDGKAFGQEMVELVKDYVTRAVRPLLQRLAELEERQPEKGEKGDPGEDGVGMAGAAIDRDGNLMVTLSNGKQLTIGRVDGRDGLGFDDLAVDYDGERTFVFRFAQGERAKEFPFQVPVMIFRGAFREQAYEQGDTVTFGGSLWVCNSPTGDKPDDGVEGWTKAIRRGRDGRNGKDGKDGERGMPGSEGRAGRDLTQMAPDGSKW
jgi:integrin beta 3